MKFENQFTVRQINLETFDYPKVEVATWSSLFGDGGSVDVQAKTPEGTRLTLYSEKIEENRDVTSEREYCQEMADEWNENLEENWDAEIIRCLDYVAKYEEDAIAKIDEHKANAKKYRDAIARLEAKQLVQTNG